VNEPTGRWRRIVEGALGPSSFVRQVGETYATQVFVVALGFVNSILVTRLLGPEGRGLFAAANTFSAVGVQLGNLGLHSWNTYHVSREPRSLPVLIGNSLAVCAASGVLALLALGFFQARPSLAPVAGVLLLLALAGIPLGLANLLFQNLLIGTQRIHDYNTIDLATRVLAVVLVAATAPLGLVSPELVFGLVLVSVVLSAVWCFAKLRRGLPGPVAWSAASLRSGLGYGVRAYLGSLFAFLVLRSDILLVKYLRGAGETGYYAIAVGLADILMMLPTVVGTVLFPRLAAAPDVASRWALARRVLAWMVPVTPVVLVATLFLARPLILLAYGPAFAPSFPAVAWLLPGIGCLAVNTVLMNLFASCGMPLVVTLSPLAALVVNVAVNLVLVPRVGFVGAAMSSTVAYALMLVVSLFYLRLRLLRLGRA
jgi:O-antigen/teichoic acid export membrane protein